MKIDRLLSIIILLLNRDKVNAEDLARRYEVTVRTIYRDMDVIGASGIPLISYPGKNGGYGIREEFRIDRQVLDVDEMHSILSALKSVSKSFDDKQSDKALEKIRNILPKAKREELEAKTDIVVFDGLPWGDESRFLQTGKTIHKAIQENKVIEFIYTGWKDEALRRTVEPLTLVFKSRAWYLFAYCRIRNDFRLFKIARISNLDVQRETYVPKKADYHDYIAWDDQLAQGVPYRLKFYGYAARHAAEFYEPSQITSFVDGSIEVNTYYPNQDWVYRYFLSFGNGLEIIEPVEARDKIVSELKEILKNYPEIHKP